MALIVGHQVVSKEAGHPPFPYIEERMVMPEIKYSSLYSELAKYNWNTDIAYRIMMCESGGNPNAVGDKNTAYSSYGLMQIRALPGRPSPEWLLDPKNNLDYAFGLYQKSGWKPWTCYRKI